MPSTALHDWRIDRAGRLDRLQAAHTTVGGTGPGRRHLTEELNHALILRLAAEFQGFARDLHHESTTLVSASLSGGAAAPGHAGQPVHHRPPAGPGQRPPRHADS